MSKKIFGVVGFPVKHSKSPDIYNYLFKKYNIDAMYIPIELDEKQIDDFFNNYTHALSLAGINLTMPHKSWGAKYAKEPDDASKLLGSVNTINLETGRGYTTDGMGLILSLKYQGIDIKNKNVVVLGAGGAAKSICYELSKEGVKELIILNRTKDKAVFLADLLGDMAKGDSFNTLPFYIKECDIIINCTSMGMTGKEEMDLSLFSSLSRSTVIYDVIYEPRQTRLIEYGKNKGCKTIGGIDMLICQALYAFEIFTGNPPCKEDRDELIDILK